MRSQQKKGKKWLKVTGFIILGIFFAAGVYGFIVYKSFKEAIVTMHQPIQRTLPEKREVPVSLEKKEPFSVLLLGVDEREGDKGRSDTIILLAVNPNSNSVKMLSIPRDTRTEIIGKGIEDKINHAYAFGGVPMSMDTVENFLDIPIDYYMQINMEGFKDIVDAVGGVKVDNDFEFSVGDFHYPKGEITLNGEEVLFFARMRYDDPRGDFGRQTRQRQIIKSVINEGMSVASLAKFSDIFGALGKNIKTNLTFDQMMDIQKNYREAGRDIQQMEIMETGKLINKVYYGLVSAEEKQRIQTELKNQLELE